MSLLFDIILFIPYALFHTLLTIVGAVIHLPRQKCKDVSEDIVLITGAGSGIGQQMAYKFAKLGSTLVIWDINTKGLAETVSEVKKLGGKIFSYVCDLTKREEVYKTAKKIREQVGVVTILINNAGIVTGKPLLETPDDMILKTFDVNILAHFWTVKAFLPDMIKYGKGHIVTISSTAGYAGAGNLVDYTASKHAAIGFDEALHMELRGRGIKNVTTTLVCPHFTNTGLFEGAKERLLSLLPPAYVADEIISGILRNTRNFSIPRYLFLILVMKTILPWKVYMRYFEKIGQHHESMKKFTGRQPVKQE